MVEYNCEKCGKVFNKKGNYTKHINRKNPCIFESKMKEIIRKIISNKISNTKSNDHVTPEAENIVIKSESIVETKTFEINTTDYTIINCCCIKGLTEMKQENKKIHLTITSPPYYNVKDYVTYSDYKEYLSTLKNIFTLIYDITIDGRMCCVNLSNILIQRENRNCESSRIPLAFHFVPLMEDIGWKFIEDIINQILLMNTYLYFKNLQNI